MLLHQRFVPGLAILSYVVGDERSGEAAVIDPTRDVGEFLAYANDHGLRIRHVIETHVHADFVSGARELKARLGGQAAVYCSGHGGAEWTPPYADVVVKDGDAIRMGGVTLRFLHTPGHTPEHVAVSLTDTARSADTPWVLFTGDFLFVGDVGRPDLLGEEAKRRLARELYRSVFERLAAVPDFTEVMPAHGAGSLCGKALGSRNASTVGYERRFNGALARKDLGRWVDDLLTGMPLAPPYFQRMKKVNKEGPPVLGPRLPGLERWSAEQVHERARVGGLVLDVRSKEAFAGGHIPGAINIPSGNSLPTWAGWVLPYDRPVFVVPEDASQMPRVATDLVRVGFDDVQGYLDGGVGAWQAAGYPVAALATVSVHDLARALQRREPLTVLDVRSESEWQGGHIGGAVHVHGGTLRERLAEVPRDRPVAVVCGSGYRSSVAASLLLREGYPGVLNVLGGMTAWKAAGLPTTTE
jgi:hydroxyacylglutathione hydrolase